MKGSSTRTLKIEMTESEHGYLEDAFKILLAQDKEGIDATREFIESKLDSDTASVMLSFLDAAMNGVTYT